MAVIAADMLFRLLVTGDLRHFQTFVDLEAGSLKSTHITLENVRQAWRVGEGTTRDEQPDNGESIYAGR
jgi:hypothetical protein